MSFINTIKRVFNAPTATATPTPQPSYIDLDEPGDGANPIEIPTLWEAFTIKYPNDARRILPSFEAANLCPATWDNLTKYRLQAFVDYLSERLAPNSVHQYCTKFKAVLNVYNEDVELPRGYAKVLSPKKQKTTKIWLTEEEIQRIIEYTPKDKNEELVKNQFLLGCLTGARFSDFIRFDGANIQGDRLVYVSQKTKTPTTVPLHSAVPGLIETTEKRELTEAGFNRCLRRICKNCAINTPAKVFRAGREQTGAKWEFCSSHTARRSFASNLYLRGVDIYSICKLMGHSDIDITQGYIVCGLRNLSEEAMGYFTA